MDVLKFIGGRRSKCIFLHLKKEKNAFRLHDEQNSNGTNDNFADGETGVLRVYIYACISFLGGFNRKYTLPAILRAESAPFCGSVECS